MKRFNSILLILWMSVCSHSLNAQICVVSENQKFTSSDRRNGDFVGSAVHLDGNRLIVGASLDDHVLQLAGSAYLYRLDDQGTPNNLSDDLWIQQNKIVASDPGMFDEFGWTVSISGDWAVVGAPYHSHTMDQDGAAYLYYFEDRWVFSGELVNPEPAVIDQFGISVSISGDHLVIGNHFDDDDGINSGSAYVYRRNDMGTPDQLSDDTWEIEEKLRASDAHAGNQEFGWAVSIDGHRIAIGAFGHRDNGINSGAVFVYKHDDNNTPMDTSDDSWPEEAKLIGSDVIEHDQFGRSVSIHLNQIISGAPFLPFNGDSGPGSAYLFRLDDNGTPLDENDDIWIEQAKLVASDAQINAQFGRSVSISDSFAIIGNHTHDDFAEDAGVAYMFKRMDQGTPDNLIDDVWTEIMQLSASDAAFNALLGWSVTNSNNRAVVGAPFAGIGSIDFVGAVYDFPLEIPDCDGDGFPDLCDDDSDGDGIVDPCDICPLGDDLIDTDKDTVPDACDPCPQDNPDDTDGDSVCDSDDPCPLDFADDSDGDTVCDSRDICPGEDDLLDSDGDGFVDCIDQCPDEDDGVDENRNGVPDCAERTEFIPTVSEWGLVIMTLSLCILAKLYSRRWKDASWT